MRVTGVLLTLPVSPYSESELDKRFTLFRPWCSTDSSEFLRRNSPSIRAVIGNADTEMIRALPRLEIVSSYSAGVNEIDMGMCGESGVRFTNTPSEVTDDDDTADLAIGLAIGHQGNSKRPWPTWFLGNLKAHVLNKPLLTPVL